MSRSPEPVTEARSADAAIGHVTRRTARNTVVRGTAELLGKLATLGWTVLIAHALTRADFGAFSYALSFMLLVSAFPAWGFDSVLVRRASVQPELGSRLYTEAVSWQTLLGVPVFLLAGAVAAATRPSPEAAVVLVVLLAAGLPELWSHSARASGSARQDQRGVSRALVLQRVATAALVVAAVVADLGVVGVAWAFFLGTALGWVAHFVALRRLRIRARWSLLSWAGMRELAVETRFVGLSALVLVLLFRVDVVLLGAMQGDKAVAVYAVAYRLLETVLFVAFAVRQAVAPVMAAARDDTRVRLGYERGIATVAVVYLPFAAVCLAEPEAVIGLLFGSSYAVEAAPILRWLSLAPLLFASAFLGFAGLVATRRHRVTLVVSAIATVVNVALNLVLIQPLAGVGAAIATTVSYLVLAGCVLFALIRGVGRIRVLRPVAEPAAAAVVLAALLVGSDLPLLLDLAVGGVVYAGVWLLLVRRFAPEQLGVVRGLLPGARG